MPPPHFIPNDPVAHFDRAEEASRPIRLLESGRMNKSRLREFIGVDGERFGDEGMRPIERFVGPFARLVERRSPGGREIQ